MEKRQAERITFGSSMFCSQDRFSNVLVTVLAFLTILRISLVDQGSNAPKQHF